MTRIASRPRAPSPPASSTYGIDNNSEYSFRLSSKGDPNSDDGDYTVVQDSVQVRASKIKIDRMFGDSVQNTLRKSSNKNEPDVIKTYVEQIKAQFQRQIENMIATDERHESSLMLPPPPPPPKTTINNNNSQMFKVKTNDHLFNAAGKELSRIPRDKSFLEARSAVQKQIEKMFEQPTNTKPEKLSPIKHVSHGVSHVALFEDDEDKEMKPPPVHYGVNDAIKNSSSPLNLLNKRTNSVDSIHTSFSSASALSDRGGKNGLRRITDSQIGDLGNIDVTDRLRKFQNFKSSAPDLTAGSGSDRFSTLSSSASSKSVLHPSTTPTTTTTTAPPTKEFVKHKVDYLGALPIGNKSTNLTALQRPLKDLYFKYRAMKNLGQSNLPGTLEINDNGLTVQYIRELHKGVQEIFNPFSTIAVWAAVKFVHRRDVIQGGNVLHRYAFLPLISDPDGSDKKRLFHNLDYHEVELASDSPHPPMFACVMRRTGTPKQLECHGFVCSASEDAIIIAANLYQALLVTMKKQKENQSSPQLPPPNHGMSTHPSSIKSTESVSGVSSVSCSGSSNGPVRPPRRRRQRPITAPASNSPSEAKLLQRRKSNRSSNRSIKRNGVGDRGVGNSSFKRKSSLRKSGSFNRRSMRKSGRRGGIGRIPQGDVYTRVAIPRSKSFMNVNSQYNLQELFRELKEKEGVESIDDVLKKIISPDGISFNEIKPVYRELLLKLAMTMSQDEIFQRSKNILSQEKKKKAKKNKNNKKDEKKSSNSTSSSSFWKSTFSSGISSKTSSGYDSQKSATIISAPRNTSGKILTKADISSPIPITPINSNTNNSNNNNNNKSKRGPVPPTPKSSSIQSRSITKTPLPPPPTSTSVPTSVSREIPSPPLTSQSDDAYMSCSECGTNYESVCSNYETCSCMGGSIHAPTRPLSSNRKDKIISAHDCSDSGSCTSSDKCYCSLRGDPRTNTTFVPSSSESCCTYSSTSGLSSCYSTTRHSSSVHSPGNLKKCNSSSALSRCESPLTAWKRNNASTSPICCSGQCNTVDDLESVRPFHRKNSGGSGYNSNDSSHCMMSLKKRAMSTDNVRYNNGGNNGGCCSCSSASSTTSSYAMRRCQSQQRVLLCSAVDPRGNVVYHGSPNKNNSVPQQKSDSSGVSSSGNKMSIMSMKKSAEIAAEFSGATINQTTDIVNDNDGSYSTTSITDDSYDCMNNNNHRHQHRRRSTQQFSESNMHTSLGYFP